MYTLYNIYTHIPLIGIYLYIGMHMCMNVFFLYFRIHAMLLKISTELFGEIVRLDCWWGGVYCPREILKNKINRN